VSNDSLFGEGRVGTPDKESPLACVADYDCTDETAFEMLMENKIISVCNMQSKEQHSASNQSKASLNVLTHDGQVMVAGVRVPSQIRADDSFGKIGMMVSLNQYLDHLSNYPMLIFSKDKSLILSFFITTSPDQSAHSSL